MVSLKSLPGGHRSEKCLSRLMYAEKCTRKKREILPHVNHAFVARNGSVMREIYINSISSGSISVSGAAVRLATCEQ